MICQLKIYLDKSILVVNKFIQYHYNFKSVTVTLEQ